MNKKEIKHMTYPTTPTIRGKKTRVDIIEIYIQQLLKGNLFFRPSLEEKIKMINLLANAKSELWESVYTKYPDILEIKKNVNISEFEIFITE